MVLNFSDSGRNFNTAIHARSPSWIISPSDAQFARNRLTLSETAIEKEEFLPFAPRISLLFKMETYPRPDIDTYYHCLSSLIFCVKCGRDFTDKIKSSYYLYWFNEKIKMSSINNNKGDRRVKHSGWLKLKGQLWKVFSRQELQY